MKSKKQTYHTVGTIPKLYIIFIERGKTPCIQIHDRSLYWLV